METRITKIISRINCPETNSSSSHSFVFSEEALKPEDLLLSTQTLVPEVKSDGKKYIELDGIRDSYEIGKRVNDSRSKAIYAIASARMILSSRKAKKKIDEIKEIIKETLNIDEVILTRQKAFSVDHQSQGNIESIIKGDRFGLKEFIFNPRIWLFLLWDSEDCYENPIFDVCPGYFNFEISTEFPFLVKRFLDDPIIHNIEVTRLCCEYPGLNNLKDFFYEEVCGNHIIGYSEKDGVVIIEKDENSYYRLFDTDKTTQDDPNVFEFFNFYGKGDDLYLLYVRSTLWKEIFENYKKLHEISDPSNDSGEKKLTEEFQKRYDEITKWINIEDSLGFYKYLLISLLGNNILDDKILKKIDLTEKDTKVFKISIYSRKADENI